MIEAALMIICSRLLLVFASFFFLGFFFFILIAPLFSCLGACFGGSIAVVFGFY
jgi:hypothetical protein